MEHVDQYYNPAVSVLTGVIEVFMLLHVLITPVIMFRFISMMSVLIVLHMMTVVHRVAL